MKSSEGDWKVGRWHRRMVKSRRKSAGDRRHRRRIQTPIKLEGQSLTEPEDAGSDESRKLGAKGKPEDAAPVKAEGKRRADPEGRWPTKVGGWLEGEVGGRNTR